jgi:hypothetical protein
MVGLQIVKFHVRRGVLGSYPFCPALPPAPIAALYSRRCNVMQRSLFTLTTNSCEYTY